MTGRFHALDAVRSAAMLLGLFFHGAISFLETPVPWAVRDRSTHWGVDLFAWACHTFRMPVFFLMSGFFARLLHERMGMAPFLRHRARRILVPFAVALVPILLSLWALWSWGWSRQGVPVVTYPGLEVPSLDPAEAELSPAHLWFLYYLAMLLAGLALVLAAVRRVPPGRADALFRAAVGSWTLPFLLAVPTGATLFFMKTIEADTPVSFVPQPRILAYYAVFFAFGWWLHRSPDLVAGFGRRLPAAAAVAALAFPLLLFPLEMMQRDGGIEPPSLRAGAVYLSALFGWSMVLLFVGVFVRWLPGERAGVRWLADSAYWCYLLHLPVVVFFQILVADWEWPGPAKYALVMGATLAVCLGSYRAFVRYSFLGTALNGRRERAAPGA